VLLCVTHPQLSVPPTNQKMTKGPRSKSPVPLVPGPTDRAQPAGPERANGGHRSEPPGVAPPESLSRAEAADYVFEMSTGLAAIAQASGLDLVAYLLQMSAEEAKKHRERAGEPSS
jgi:hypothetical protein